MSPMQQMFLGLGAVAEKTYIDDLFSTYLYSGDNSTIIVNNGVALGSSMSGNSANLSNTNDANKLNRTSAMTGVSAGKTFTVSAWVFIPNTGTYGQLFYVDTGSQTRFELGFGNYIQISARNSSNTKFLDVYTPSNVPITPGQWNHILVSMDLTNTSNRHVYVNDSSVSMTYQSYGNENILFNESKVSIFGEDGNNNLLFGYLSNFYFDQTYRNLGTTSNRRLFYAADGTPATGQASLNPVIYYKFDTLSTTNAGSGGDFTFSGSPTLATFGPYKDTDAANGGLVWIKSRTSTYGNFLFDTERGTSTALSTNLTNANFSEPKGVKDFNVNGFTIGGASGDGAFNASGTDYASFTFRQAPGFFDCIKFTGSGGTSSSPQSISHSLESIPGMIIIKNLTQASQWFVYHKSTGVNKFLQLNKPDVAVGYNGGFSNITSSSFSVFDSNSTNTNEFVAYVFAGGESTAATATSCNFLGTSASGNYDNNKIFCGTTNGTKTADLVYGTGDFTWEAWVKCESSSNIYRRVFHHGQEWTNGTALGLNWDHNSNQNQFSLWSYNLSTNSAIVHSQTHNFDDDGQWHHVAVSRQSGTFRIFVDGILEGTNSSYSGSTESVSTSYLTIGATHNANVQECFKGNISNVRIVKGTAVYTSSFRPPTEPLTNITNTKLLCCNGSSVTSATVTPITLTVGDSSVTASTDSPFDDPAGFVFGDSKEAIVKCGSYTGNGDATNGTNVYLGFEPQWVLIKPTGFSEHWHQFDSMRGMPNGDIDSRIEIDVAGAETNTVDFLNINPDGFTALYDPNINKNNEDFIYIAIRRSDGHVGKPPELGTSVFAMDTGNNSSTIPAFDSGFPVDFALMRQPATSESWYTGARLMSGPTGGRYLKTDSTSAQNTNIESNWVFDSNTGWVKSYSSSYQSWMWKRHAGFDVVAYKGNGSLRTISHSMGIAPEMMWFKKRNSSKNWYVYHKGLDGGSSPEDYSLRLNTNAAEDQDGNTLWNQTVPTATHFTINTDSGVNADGDDYIAMLFASVDGISKVGSYTGTGSGASGHAITLGFSPRLLIIKRADGTSNWLTLDTLRGLGTSGNENYLLLSTSGAQVSVDWVNTTSTGFNLMASGNHFNDNGSKFIYYAHA